MVNKKTSKKRNRTTDVKSAAANDNTELAATKSTPAAPIVLPKPERITANQIATDTVVSARTASIRRSVAGKFNKVVLSQIGGKECPRFYPMTWVERDKFMAGDSEAAKIVTARYDLHMKGVE